jgi:hypothetical protein
MQQPKYSSDSGSALIEFVALATLLMLPIMWFSIDLIGKQNDQFAATAMAEHGIRAWVQSATAESSSFEMAIRQIATDFHELESDVNWQVDCGPISPCEPRGQVLRLTVQVKAATASAVMRWVP